MQTDHGMNHTQDGIDLYTDARMTFQKARYISVNDFSEKSIARLFAGDLPRAKKTSHRAAVRSRDIFFKKVPIFTIRSHI